MSLINFGVSTAQQGVIQRLKPYPTPNVQSHVPANGIPVVRAGNKNFFTVTQTSAISDAGYRTVVNLYSTNPVALVTATDFTVVAAGSKIYAMWLSSTDQCLYVVYKGMDGLIRLSKINDSTGAVTHIGAGFTPTTPANWSWPANLELIAGDLRFTHQGKYHTIDKTTGAVVTQDNVFNLGGYSDIAANYVSLDGSTYSSGNFLLMPLSAVTSVDGVLQTPRIVSTTTGVILEKYVREELVLGTNIYGRGAASTPYWVPMVLVDADKVCLYMDVLSVGFPLNVVLRSNYDSFLQSIVNYAAGL